jgi:hypothetical protein
VISCRITRLVETVQVCWRLGNLYASKVEWPASSICSTHRGEVTDSSGRRSGTVFYSFWLRTLHLPLYKVAEEGSTSVCRAVLCDLAQSSVRHEVELESRHTATSNVSQSVGYKPEGPDILPPRHTTVGTVRTEAARFIPYKVQLLDFLTLECCLILICA